MLIIETFSPSQRRVLQSLFTYCLSLSMHEGEDDVKTICADGIYIQLQHFASLLFCIRIPNVNPETFPTRGLHESRIHILDVWMKIISISLMGEPCWVDR